ETESQQPAATEVADAATPAKTEASDAEKPQEPTVTQAPQQTEAPKPAPVQPEKEQTPQPVEQAAAKEAVTIGPVSKAPSSAAVATPKVATADEGTQTAPQQPEAALSIGPVGRLEGYRSEEHTSELQSRFELVCRLLLEKKNREAEEKR